MKENITAKKSVAFAIKIVQLCKSLTEEKKEFVLSKQLLRSDTAIRALIREAAHAESKADFLHKMNISLKEANESDYWLFLFHEGRYISADSYSSFKNDCGELVRLLASIVKTTKTSLGR